tara:strand:+ start:370 stop:1170 length:801 start_codon:yes stop_codon:yes gene_type:complete
MKHLIQKLLWKFNYDLSRLNATDIKIKELIKLLRPIDVEGKELIRIGKNTEIDGNYLIPDDIKDIEYCFSLGVGKSSAFELHLAEMGIKSFITDYSVDKLPVENSNLIFDKKFVNSYNSDRTITFMDWKEKYLKNYNKDMIMQMDIEGDEYKVLLDIPQSELKKFRIMVIEFHFLTRLFDFHSNQFIYSCLRKILEEFYVVHIHPNNHSPVLKKNNVEIPHYLEITFLRKDRVDNFKFASRFPHPLDIKNCKDKPDIVLPKSWYHS